MVSQMIIEEVFRYLASYFIRERVRDCCKIKQTYIYLVNLIFWLKYHSERRKIQNSLQYDVCIHISSLDDHHRCVIFPINYFVREISLRICIQ